MEQVAADRNPAATAIERRAKLFRGFADPSRLAILDALCSGSLVVHEIVGRTALTQSNVSNHLRCLSECGLVSSMREGRFVHYRISNPRIADLLQDADAILDAVTTGLEACRNYGADEDEFPS